MKRRGLAAIIVAATFAVANAQDSALSSAADQASEAAAKSRLSTMSLLPRQAKESDPAVAPCSASSATKKTLSSEPGSAPCESIPTLPGPPELSTADTLRCGLSKSNISPLFGPFINLILNSAPYVEASVFPPMLPSLPPNIGKPLLDDWAAIERAFEDAADFMRRAAAGGGVGPPGQNGFHNPGVSPTEARVDVEVNKGHAFVYCPAKKNP